MKSPIASATDVASSLGQLYYNATITISHCDNKDNNNKKKHSFHTMRILPQFIWLITWSKKEWREFVSNSKQSLTLLLLLSLLSTQVTTEPWCVSSLSSFSVLLVKNFQTLIISYWETQLQFVYNFKIFLSLLIFVYFICLLNLVFFFFLYYT